MFNALRFRIALWFTITTFVLLLLQGYLFMTLQYRQDLQRLQGRLAEDAQRIIFNLGDPPQLSFETLSPVDQVRSRFFTASGENLYTGTIFLSEPVEFKDGAWIVRHQASTYLVRTFPIQVSGETVGFLQLGELHTSLTDRFVAGSILLILQSLILSFFVFSIGYWFERRAFQSTQDTMEHMTQFTEDAGHELRTPLASMRSSLELALSNHKGDSDIEAAIEDIERLGSLVDTLMQLSTLSKLTLDTKPTDFSQLTRDAMREFETTCRERSIQMTPQITPDIIRMADSGLAHVVIRNLLHNAVKFTKPGGEIHVTLTSTYYEVRDNGVGMAPDVLDNIFERFFKADLSRSNAGFGLGLTLVKKIADLHGWSVTVRSALGNGTTFMVWLSPRVLHERRPPSVF